jgi:hypothetical protein
MVSAARAALSTTRQSTGSVVPAQEEPAGSPKLDVPDRRTAAAQSRRRQATILRTLGALLVVGALAATAVAHALVASDQQRLDTLQSQLTQMLIQQQGLQLTRAELESPVRVLHIAENQLGMVVPPSVSYLPAVDPGPSVAQAGASAARAALAAADRAAKRPGVRTSGTSPSTGAGSPATAFKRR